MSGKSGNHPHKRNHVRCIGWIYCKRLDKTYDIGEGALVPDKQGYRCDCGYMTKLDPFKHEVHYYDDENQGVEPVVSDDNLCRLKPDGECTDKHKCVYGNKVWHDCKWKDGMVKDLGLDGDSEC